MSEAKVSQRDMAAGWYEAAEDPELVEHGPVSGLAVTGRGEPGGAAYNESVGALYAVLSALGAPMVPLVGRGRALAVRRAARRVVVAPVPPPPGRPHAGGPGL